jgi:hypothetical protein
MSVTRGIEPPWRQGKLAEHVEPRWGSNGIFGSEPSVRCATLGFGVQRLRRRGCVFWTESQCSLRVGDVGIDSKPSVRYATLGFGV